MVPIKRVVIQMRLFVLPGCVDKASSVRRHSEGFKHGSPQGQTVRDESRAKAALFNELHVRLKAAGETHGRAEGVELGGWVLLDYSDVVVHLLQPEAREYYDLDRLYGDCPKLDWESVELPKV